MTPPPLRTFVRVRFAHAVQPHHAFEASVYGSLGSGLVRAEAYGHVKASIEPSHPGHRSEKPQPLGRPQPGSGFIGHRPHLTTIGEDRDIHRACYIIQSGMHITQTRPKKDDQTKDV